ncbi:MAG: DUF1573 domain-containing protein [Flavobacterium sp.]|nr:MAG: DUF1573 domain-containing protein [Flavobacterium sp.]
MKTLKITLLAFTFGLMSFAPKTITDEFIKSALISPLSWKSDTVDVGEIPQNIAKTILFEFVNTGKTEITITNVQPSCGCTTSDYTKTPIKPGETAKVNAVYNASNKGAFTKTIKVTTNAEEAPKNLTFKGTVI